MNYHDRIKKEFQNLLSDFGQSTKNFDEAYRSLQVEAAKLQKMEEQVKQLAKERQMGFPVLAKAYDEFFALQDKELIDFFKYKDKPALRAGDIIKEYGKLRREALKDKKIYQYLVEYYESVCPFLIELKEEVFDITEEDQKLMADYAVEELEDEVTQFLTKEEYRKLTSIQRNQLALDRYWKRPKSKWHIGKIYERYVGYLYEEKGYDVEYVGIFKGLEDLGRDIIAIQGNNIVVIQCKNWSQFRTIYEKHIFQFFGTVFQYKDENKGKEVKSVFYTTTKVSDLARRFAQELGMELQEGFRMDNQYACIKCNISRIDDTKIYHLPFDQQYDNVKIEKKRGEFYCKTVEEAEKAGFRRAFKYKGYQKNNSQ